MQCMVRRILVTLLLIIVSLGVIVFVGFMGLGKRVGAPGLDALVSGIKERFFRLEGIGPAPDTTLPGDMNTITGTWSGISDIDGTEWKFTFEENYAVRVSSAKGYFHQGTAFVHWKLGLTDGILRVPPGWSVLDVDIIQSSDPLKNSTISLGAFSRRENLLKYCFTEPGRLTRPINDMSREGIRCFELTKAVAGTGRQSGMPRPRPTPEKASSSQPSGSSPPFAESAEVPRHFISGEAETTIDGVTETLVLRTDAGSSTDLANPRRLTLQFQAHGTKFPGSRRIELTIDGTRKGRHRADGFAYLDNLFMREKVPVGSDAGQEPAAILLYIADGGRIFPPRASCWVTISSTYRDLENISLSGRVSDCVVDSAGESHMVSSLVFSVKGRKR